MNLSCFPVSIFAVITARKITVTEWPRIGAGRKLEAIDLSILFLLEQTIEANSATSVRKKQP